MFLLKIKNLIFSIIIFGTKAVTILTIKKDIYMIKICQECKIEFKTYSNKSKFCSKHCSVIFNNKLNSNPPVILECMYCHSSFSIQYKFRNRKFCSQKCFSNWQKDPILSKENRLNKSLGHMGVEPFNKNKTYEEIYGNNAQEMRQKCKSKRTPKPDVKLICAYCSCEYYIKYKNRNKSKYCSPKCASSARIGIKPYEASEITREKMSKAKKGKIRKQSQEEIKNRRILFYNKMQQRLNMGLQIIPNWNPKACDYFENFDKQNNTRGQHARNGGEFYIKELGYWVDYINHDLKLIMEYDEQKHFDTNGDLRKKDLIRQQEIQEVFPDYEFKRIKE